MAVLILGDFTAMVGDPSGKSATRPRLLARQEVDAHVETYVEQIGEISTSSPERSRCGATPNGSAPSAMEDILRLTSQVTVARMLERDDFAKRYAGGPPISLMEFLYPLLQGLDSVEVRADVELGGTDQLFNLIVGRHLQERAGQQPQVVLTRRCWSGSTACRRCRSRSATTSGSRTRPRPVRQDHEHQGRAAADVLPRGGTAGEPDRIDEAVAVGWESGVRGTPNAAKRSIGRAVVDLYHGDGAGRDG